MPAKRTAKPFSRAGAHRLECDCGNFLYATVQTLERFGLPACPCGERFLPGRVELAELLDVDCPARDEYRAEVSSVMHGQGSHLARGRQLRDPSVIAAERVERRRHERSLSNRLGDARRPVQPAMPF